MFLCVKSVSILYTVHNIFGCSVEVVSRWSLVGYCVCVRSSTLCTKVSNHSFFVTTESKNTPLRNGTDFPSHLGMPQTDDLLEDNTMQNRNAEILVNDLLHLCQPHV